MNAKEAAKKKVLRPSGATKSSSFVEKYLSSSPTLYYSIATAVLVYAYFAFFSGGASVKNFVNADRETIKGLLTGESPYLFYCHTGGKVTPPELLTDLSSKVGSKYGFGALNCSQTLPSGKSIYDRLKLRRDWKPVVFGYAPWKKHPVQASKEYLKDSAALASFVDKFLAPRAPHIDTDNDLKRICGFGKKKKTRGSEEDDEEEESEMSSIKNTCLVLIKGTQHSKKHAELEEKLIRHMPRAKIGILDASKKRLSFEDVEDQPADSFSLQVYAVREGTHYLPMTNAVTWDYLNTFVSYAFAQPLSAYSVPQEGGRTIKVVKVASAFRDRTKPRSGSKSSKKPASSPSTKPTSSKKPSSTKSAGGGTSAGAGGGAETNPRAESERARRRREEMDRQSEQHHVQEEDEEDAEEGADEGDDDSEDVIEL